MKTKTRITTLILGFILLLGLLLIAGCSCCNSNKKTTPEETTSMTQHAICVVEAMTVGEDLPEPTTIGVTPDGIDSQGRYFFTMGDMQMYLYVKHTPIGLVYFIPDPRLMADGSAYEPQDGLWVHEAGHQRFISDHPRDPNRKPVGTFWQKSF